MGGDEQKPVDEILDQIDPQTKIIGKETIDGHKTVIIETSVEGIKEKIWFSEEYGLPLKMEARMTDGTTVITEIKNLQVGNVSDADVTLPPGAQIMQLPNFGTE